MVISGTPWKSNIANEGIHMKLLIITASLATCATVSAQIYVKPYIDRNGTVHEGHYRSSPNQNRYDNLNSETNVYNPYTGKKGNQRDEFSSEPEYNKRNDGYNRQSKPSSGVYFPR